MNNLLDLTNQKLQIGSVIISGRFISMIIGFKICEKTNQLILKQFYAQESRVLDIYYEQCCFFEDFEKIFSLNEIIK